MLVPENVRKPSVVSMDSPKILVGLGQHPVAPVAEEVGVLFRKTRIAKKITMTIFLFNFFMDL